jgi:hypothetical protein
MPRRCMDCLWDATHTLYWHPRVRQWESHPSRNQRALHLYCRWHATVRAVQRNARGVLPPMEQLYKLLGYPVPVALEEDDA